MSKAINKESLMAEFDNKVVIVTGGSSGIGEAVVKRFVQDNAKVVVSDINQKLGQALVDSIKAAGCNAAYFQADVADPAQVEELVKFAVQLYGGLHVMVNNAGIGGEQAATADYSLESWRKVIDVNLNGVFYGMKYAIPAILKSGGGSIINIASILGDVGFPNAVAYVSAKHGVVGMTKVAAMEYSAQGIRINAVGPAFINTPLLSGLDDNLKQMLVGMHPIGRLGESPEVAELVAWLASDKASFCTGAYYPVDGGYLTR
jgi:NAD(P)-dependent dehydrogenase (short-subunit alcohol dehydrogenase family)